MKKILLLLLSLCLIQAVQAQDKRPKVGVVLSGGGAKGLAHIGVLKVLEEAGVQVDYIGGTSMGAIIGGLYASGYSARQLDSIFREVDSDALLQDYIPRTSKSFFEKRNDEVYALSLPFNNFKIGVPTALSKGLYNYNLLTRLTNHVRHIRNFNDLPIPFVCIATDIENGHKVVLNKGILPQAILASGAFPSLYSPVEIDGRILIDGGVVDNYPLEEIKKMGADIIIGVDVQDGLKDRNTIGGATGVLLQITNFSMIGQMEAKKKATDIYIKPNIQGYSVISFDQGGEIIKKGEEAAFSVYEDLAKLGAIASKSVLFEPRRLTDTLQISKIEINGIEGYTRAYVLGKLRFHQNSKITNATLDKGINNLNATQNFSSISYYFEEAEKGDNLVLNLKENPLNRYLKFGLHYDELYKSAVLLNLTQKKFLLKNDVVSLDVILGDNFRYNLNYYIDNGFYWSFGFNSRYNRFNKNVATDFSDGQILTNLGLKSINVDFSDFTNQIYLQTVFAQKFLIGAGLEHKHLKIRSSTLENIGGVISSDDYFSIFGNLKYDSFDQKYFPKRGWYFSGDFHTTAYTKDGHDRLSQFSIAKADAGIVKTFYKTISLKVQSEAGFTIGKEGVPYYNFVLGGYGYQMINNFRHFYGYDFLSIAGDSYIKGSATLDYEFYKKHHINFTANYAYVGQKIFNTTDWFLNANYSGYALGYGFETLIGPIEVKYSWSPETKDGSTWFSVGFWF
ncbi:patatin [Flavobacterium supellecticarium]|uniref:Patatin n=1 Tax=Flavobacterium supellecticarium TaxID=2565924 RepID=A0A4S3ZRH5_9FLAO|nr:patatin-like phospholipase family protein [Flavobacterium supellecticarium]THF48171.1 patatin [Flavobacterium supellecticarium]